jgi:outer membrane immunogenic protein
MVGSNNLTLLDVPTGNTVSFSNNNTNSGWTAGAGVEWAFADNWSVRAEYDYVGLSNYTYTVPATGFALANDTSPPAIATTRCRHLGSMCSSTRHPSPAKLG